MRKKAHRAPVLRPAMILLAAVAAFVVGAYVLLPSFLERSAARTIQGELGLESTPELERGSPWEVLTGRFPGGRVTMEGVGLGGVRAERVVVDLYLLDLDLPASILGVRSRARSRSPARWRRRCPCVMSSSREAGRS